MQEPLDPTPDQQRVVDHESGAFVSACAGAGKTEVLVARARRILRNEKSGKGIAFLSFTNAAIEELAKRLKINNVLPAIPFPSFIGTFDSFLWQFFIHPLGIPGATCVPRLIADRAEHGIQPSHKAQEIPLECFDRMTGTFLTHKLHLHGVNPKTKPALASAYGKKVLEVQRAALKRGDLDFDDVRSVVKQHLDSDKEVRVLARAISARFGEIIVDETQDCNKDDIEIINWLRAAGIRVLIVCDPHQAIFEFRGGVTDQLFAVRESYPEKDRLRMSGNFRSTKQICKVVSSFRSKDDDAPEDEALGKYANETTPIQLLEYAGEVTAAIGAKALQIAQDVLGSFESLPVLATTKVTLANAVGQPSDTEVKGRTCALAFAVNMFHAATEPHGRGKAIDKIHRIVLELRGHLGDQSYHQYLAESGLEAGIWRPQIIQLARAMEYSTERFSNADAWLEQARTSLLPFVAEGSSSIRQWLPASQKLSQTLASTNPRGLVARTIHSVKGAQFPAVCVVMPPNDTKAIFDLLATGLNKEDGETLRKIYVAVSRAQRLLVLAVPKSQMSKMKYRLATAGVLFKVHKVFGNQEL